MPAFERGDTLAQSQLAQSDSSRSGEVSAANTALAQVALRDRVQLDDDLLHERDDTGRSSVGRTGPSPLAELAPGHPRQQLVAQWFGPRRESDPDPAAACVCAAHGLVGLRVWPKRPSCFKSDNTPLTSKNRLWRRIPVQNPLHPDPQLVDDALKPVS
jgi:hypothetical protein